MNRIQQLLAVTASLIICCQVVIIAVKGQAFCLNQGCQIVENLTTVSPLLFNLIGLAYFQAVFWVLRFYKARVDWLNALLLAGLAVEGVLLAYQIFVIRTLCSYCLIVFALVVVLNAMAGRRQCIGAAAILIGINLTFPLLSFGPSLVLSRFSSLDAGTYAVRTCSAPAKQLYLFFSSNCRHCRNVIQTLENCNSCDFHFNPTDRIESFDLEGLELKQPYSPEMNRLILKLLGIQEVPVLLVRSRDGYVFIKGEQKISSYIRRACFQAEPLLYLDPALYPDREDISVYDEQQGECSMTIDCDDVPQKSQ